MYDYRSLNSNKQKELLAERKRKKHPWHSPPHLAAGVEFRIVTGVCFEHQKLLNSPERLAWFADQLLDTISNLTNRCDAWCVLPNHYHVLVEIADIRCFAKGLGQLHGRTAYEMNLADHARGRKVWYRSQDRVMRSDLHYYASMNYIHNNPVKHGYVTKWQDWPYSSAHRYLEMMGREWLLDVWREYPVLNYGEGWDEV